LAVQPVARHYTDWASPTSKYGHITHQNYSSYFKHLTIWIFSEIK
jgi:hypothetical protein